MTTATLEATEQDEALDAVADAPAPADGEAPAAGEASPPPPPRPISQAEGELKVTDFNVRRQGNKVTRLTLEVLVPDRLLIDAAVFATECREDCEGSAALAVADSPLAARRPVLLGKLKAVRDRVSASQKAAEELRQEAERLEALKPAPADLGERLVELDAKIADSETRAKSEAAQIAALQSALDANFAGLEPIADRACWRAHSPLHLAAVREVTASVEVLRAALTRCPEILALVNARIRASSLAGLESLHSQATTKSRVIKAALVVLGHTEEEPGPVHAQPAPPQPPAHPAGWQAAEPDQADAQQQGAPVVQPAKVQAAPAESGVYGGREGRIKIPRGDFPRIRERLDAGETQSAIAAEYGVDRSRISQCMAILREADEADADSQLADAPKQA